MPTDRKLLLAAIDAGRTNSYGTDEQSGLGARRAKAIEAYLGLNTDPAPEGRSQVVDRSVYQTISTILPSLVRIFASSSEEVCKFVPVGPEDEQAAEQQTAVINHVVTQQNPWEQIATDWIWDALVLCNGYAMAYWDESEKTVRETYEDQSDDQLTMLMQEDVHILEQTTKPDEEADKEAAEAYQQALQQYQQAIAQVPPGQPAPPPPQKPQPQFLHDVVVERTETSGKVCIEVLPPEHCYVSLDTPNWTLERCPYFEFRQQKTISELRAMGLEVPLDISDDESQDAEEDDARDRFGESNIEGDEKGVQRRVWARMIWVEADAEGDDKTRLYYVIAVGKTILYDEPCSRIPTASMTAQPLPHRHPGMSVAETMIDVQEQKTAIKRGALDNLYLANNGRHAVSDQVNLEDFLDARPGGLVRLLNGAMPGDGHILPITHPVMFDQTIGALEYIDQEGQNRSGATRYFSGTDAGAINKTAAGTGMLQNAAAQRVEHYARMMAPAVEYLFSVVQEVMAKHKNKELTLKLKGNWTPISPLAWQQKRDVRISVGVGAGNKESMQLQLNNVLAAQMQVGLPLGLVTRDNIHATNVEILKLSGFANPQKFWPDPNTLPPQQQQQSPEQIKAQTEMQKLQFQAQQDQQKFQAEQQFEQQRMQMQVQIDAQREEMQARQKQLESEQSAQLDRIKAQYADLAEQRRLEFEKWRAELEAVVKLQIAGMGDQTQRDLATPDTSVSDGIAGVVQMLQELAASIDAPAELIRNPQTGRAEGVRKGNKVRKINRGPDGRAIGLQ